MIPIKRPVFLTSSTVPVLAIVAFLAGVYFIVPPLNGALRPAAFLLLGLLVIFLVIREIAARKQAGDAAAKARSLNAELDQRVAQRTLELQESNRKLETEMADHQIATEQLRLLTAHLQSAREEERIRIAQEIHDEIGTLMTAIKMDLAYLSKEIAGKGGQKAPEVLCQEIGDTTKLVDNAIQTIHQIVLELRPAVLDHMGLRPALEWQLQEFQTRTRVQCQFTSSLDSIHLDAERSTAVFRILQEALTNVARHALATRVEASLREEEGRLVLQVRDDGRGISEEQISGTGQFGLLGMRERAHVFGGDVVVRGSRGQGTVVTVRIPLPRSREGSGD